MPEFVAKNRKNALKSIRLSMLGGLLSLALSGCVSYLTPGPGAPMRELVEGDYTAAAARQPAAQFPARLAIVHIQGKAYRSYGARGYGDGSFSVVDTREVEKSEDFSTIVDWPEVLGIVPLSRTLLPSNMSNLDALRGLAQAARADILFLYTFDTTFYVESKSFVPDQNITLGVLPGREAHVTSSASGVFVDANSGFVYGLAKGDGNEKALMTQWTQPSAADDTRLKAERAAFTDMMQDASAKWKRIAKHYAVTVPVRNDAPVQPLQFQAQPLPAPANPTPAPTDDAPTAEQAGTVSAAPPAIPEGSADMLSDLPGPSTP